MRAVNQKEALAKGSGGDWWRAAAHGLRLLVGSDLMEWIGRWLMGWPGGAAVVISGGRPGAGHEVQLESENGLGRGLDRMDKVLASS